MPKKPDADGDGKSPSPRMKVSMTVEAEVERTPGFSDKQLGKVAVGYLWMLILQAADKGSNRRGAIHKLGDGEVSFQKPKVVKRGGE